MMMVEGQSLGSNAATRQVCPAWGKAREHAPLKGGELDRALLKEVLDSLSIVLPRRTAVLAEVVQEVANRAPIGFSHPLCPSLGEVVELHFFPGDKVKRDMKASCSSRRVEVEVC